MVQVETDNVLVVIGSLVGLFCLTVVFLGFLGLGYQDQDRGGRDLVHQWVGCLEHTDLDVDADSLLHETSLLVEARSFWPLLHLLAHTGDLDNQVLVVKLLGDFHTSWHAAHLDGCPSDTRIALCVVLLNVDPLVLNLT